MLTTPLLENSTNLIIPSSSAAAAPIKKAEVQTIVAEPPAGGLMMVRFETPAVEVTETVLLGTGPGAAGAVVDLFYELGLA